MGDGKFNLVASKIYLNEVSRKVVNCDANKFLIFIYFYMLNSILNVCQAFNAKKQVKQLSKNFCLNVQKIHSRLLKRLPLAAGKPSYANECRATRAAGAQ